MARRSLSSEEEQLWSSFARSIRPLRAKRVQAPAASGSLRAAIPDISSSGIAQGASALRVEIRAISALSGQAAKPGKTYERLRMDSQQPGLDTTSWKALASGRMKPQRRLDLHGHFAQDAFSRLHHFLHAASSSGMRCVEVITGLGSGQEGGVIRQELPHWLERGDLRPLILAVVHTHKRNKGAVRILLRARR